MKYLFISGIPTAGKSYLAERVAQKTNSLHIDIDDLREEMSKNPNLKSWVNFFSDKNEEKYWNTITLEEHWSNLLKQSEAFWPTILEKIHKIQQTGEDAIFEGVNILPHLAHKDLDFPGIVLLGESESAVFERCKRDPRWGKTAELQKKEAEWFFVHEGKKYKEEANKYGYQVFTNAEEAEKELLKLMGK